MMEKNDEKEITSERGYRMSLQTDIGRGALYIRDSNRLFADGPPRSQRPPRGLFEWSSMTRGTGTLEPLIAATIDYTKTRLFLKKHRRRGGLLLSSSSSSSYSITYVTPFPPCSNLTGFNNSPFGISLSALCLAGPHHHGLLSLCRPLLTLFK